jgi:hypothetical protein
VATRDDRGEQPEEQQERRHHVRPPERAGAGVSARRARRGDVGGQHGDQRGEGACHVERHALRAGRGGRDDEPRREREQRRDVRHPRGRPVVRAEGAFEAAGPRDLRADRRGQREGGASEDEPGAAHGP